jgi:hypothetical protein
MVHPTCAPARHPDLPPAKDDPSDKARGDLATLTTQAVGEINALREAYHAAACIHDLVASARAARDDELRVASTELHALVKLVNTEFERRVQLVKTTLASMRTP